MYRLKGKTAFTLAEVLISLAIIGIVAAITIPSVINKYKTHVASVRLKKFYSMMSQAIQMSEIDNGEVKNWDKSVGDIKDEEGEFDYTANSEACYKFFSTYIAPYIKYNDVKKFDGNTYLELEIKLADGSQFSMHNGNCVDILYDVNGEQYPNKGGYDQFKFSMRCADTSITGGKYFAAIYYKHNFARDRDAALTLCQNDNNSCSALLQFDNWEFKSDYPYKL